MYCSFCNKRITEEDVICPNCGKQVKIIELQDKNIILEEDKKITAKDLGKSVLRYLLDLVR